MNRWKQVLTAIGLAGALTGSMSLPAQAMTVYATPWVKDAPGGKWEKTCRYDQEILPGGRVRLHEVRQSNVGTLWKPCLRTGYSKTGYKNESINVIWWY